MSTHPPTELDKIIERYRPRYTNNTVAKNGHDCNLPVWVGLPVALNPNTALRAEVGLVVHCEICDALWQVTKGSQTVNHNGPDLLWVERRPYTRFGRTRLMRSAVHFNEATAWAKPDPTTIDWAAGKPRRPDGMVWWQMDFAEMCGHGDDRCQSTSQVGHGTMGGKIYSYTFQCVLKLEHTGLHESPDPMTGVHGWS